MKRAESSYPDTNVIVRYLVQDDARLYARAKDYFDAVRTGARKAVILESVVAESIHVLMKIYQVPRERVAGSLLDILHYKGIANDDRKALIAALDLFTAGGMDIVDCIICAKARAHGAALFSYDRELVRICEGSQQ